MLNMLAFVVAIAAAAPGSLAIGKDADIIAVAGDPSVNVRAVESVAFVMKSGAIVKR